MGFKLKYNNQTILFIFNDRQRKALRDHFHKDKYKVIFDIGCMAGLRESEISCLNYKRGDIDFRHNIIKVYEGCKYSKNRIMPLHHELKKVLKDYVHKNLKNFKHGYLFMPDPHYYKRSDHISSNSIRVAFEQAYDKSPFRSNYKKSKRGMLRHWCFHTTRHYFASKCINTGCDIELLAKMLGHNNVMTTLIVYGHLFKYQNKAMQDLIRKIRF